MKRTAILVATILAIAVTDSLAQQGGRPGASQGGQPGVQPGGQPGGQPGRGGRGGRGGNNLMGALDLNSDGTLDAREIQSAPLSLRKLDTNKDFKLTPDELGGRGGGNMSSRMLEMDANKDGKLTADEVPERMQPFIDRMDTNGDGAVDKSEMEAMQRRFQEGGGRGGNGGGGRQPED